MTFKIINIRGANGSGKSWIVRQLMKDTQAQPIYHDPLPGSLIGRIVGYKGDYEGTPIYFVGSYEIMSGGADAVMKHFDGLDKVCDLVREFAPKGHVVFEGFIVSGLFKRFYDLSQELGGITWCYMNTPLKVCYARIKRRNAMKTAADGRVRKGMGIKHVSKKFDQAETTRIKFLNEGEEVFIINYRRPMEAIREVLRGSQKGAPTA